MLPELALSDESIHSKRRQLAWMVWGIVVVIVCVRTIIWLRSNSVVQQYQEAGYHWANGIELYQRLNDTCRYSPTVHAMFVPFGLMPERLSSVLWRLLNATIFLVGLRYWLRTVSSDRLSGTEQAVILLLAVPLSIGSFNNGQGNVMMVGSFLIATAAAIRGNWWIAAAGIALACTLKLYPVSLALLMTLTLPIGFAWRWGLLFAGAMALPFVLQDPSYVARQYPRWLSNLVHDDRSGWDLTSGYRDLWALIRVFHLPIERSAYMFVQLGFAGLAALCCIWMRFKQVPRREMVILTVSLGCAWMALCGPATESSTFILLAPTMAWCLFETWKRKVPTYIGALYVLASALLLAGAFVVIFPFGKSVQAYGPQPMGALLFMIGLTARSFTIARSQPQPVETQTAPETFVFARKAA